MTDILPSRCYIKIVTHRTECLLLGDVIFVGEGFLMNAKLSENKIPVVTRIADTEHVGSSCFNFAVNIFFIIIDWT